VSLKYARVSFAKETLLHESKYQVSFAIVSLDNISFAKETWYLRKPAGHCHPIALPMLRRI